MSRNTDNSGSARAARLRRIAASQGPTPAVRANIGSQALDAVLGKMGCCTTNTNSSTVVFSFDQFNAENDTQFTPTTVDLNEQRTVTSPLLTSILVIIPTTTIPASFDISSYTSYNPITYIFQYSWGTIENTDGIPCNFLYYAATSHAIVTSSQFVPGVGPDIYTFDYTSTLTYNVAHLENEIATISMVITGTIPASFMFGEGSRAGDTYTYSWGTITTSDTYFTAIYGSTITAYVGDFVNTGGSNYTYTYIFPQTAVFYNVTSLPPDLDLLTCTLLVACIYTGYPLMIGQTYLNINQAVLFPNGATCFLAGSPVTLADGSTKPIEEMKVGDTVLGAFGEHNTVIAVKQSVLGDGRMCKINDTHVTTLNHPHLTADKKFVSCNGAKDSTGALLTDLHSLLINTASDKLYYAMFELKKGRVKPIERGTLLQSVDGPRPVHSMELLSLPADTPIYNLSVSGSHTYYVNGYAVTGDMKESDFDVDRWISHPENTVSSST